jgi:hypothetical protein
MSSIWHGHRQPRSQEQYDCPLSEHSIPALARLGLWFEIVFLNNEATCHNTVVVYFLYRRHWRALCSRSCDIVLSFHGYPSPSATVALITKFPLPPARFLRSPKMFDRNNIRKPRDLLRQTTFHIDAHARRMLQPPGQIILNDFWGLGTEDEPHKSRTFEQPASYLL